MKCNWWRWLWGTIPILVLSWVAVQAEQGRIEADLRARSTHALAQGGVSWAAVQFAGRDATLSGQTSDEAEPQNAAARLQSVWGVRTVENRIDLAPVAKKYTWTAGRRGSRIRITGYVPNRATRKIILGVAKANFPGFEVVDRMATTRGVPSLDTWLGGVSFALKQLAGLKRGDVRLENLGMWISGEAEDVAAYHALKSALANSLPKGIKLTDDLVTAPVVSPFTWSAQFADGRLVLSGYVPSEAARAELLAAAKASVATTAIEDKMQPGEGAPQGWSNIVVAVVRQVARLEAGGAEMHDTALAISGLAADGATLEAVRAALHAGLPTTIQLSENIKAKDPPPPSPAPRPPAPATDAQPVTPDRSQATAAPPAAPDIKSEQATESTQPSKPSPAPPSPPEPAQRTANVAEVQARACEDRLQSLVKNGHIIFDVGSAELDNTSFATLDNLADAAKTCPSMHIEVGGHASAEGSAVTNQTLSIRRAKSVVAYLVKAGVDASQLQSVGYGASRPVAPNDTSENMAKNRRIQFKVWPK